MTISTAFGIAGALIGSVGGAALLIAGLSSWLGKVWANRILEKDRLRYLSELERIKGQIESQTHRNQLVFSLYFEGQFKIYNDLWVALVELQHWVEQLWEEANTRNFQKFVTSLQRAKRQIQNSALLIEPDHYMEIMEALQALEEYRVGKEKLVSIRRADRLEQSQIQDVVRSNQLARERINSFVDGMLTKMRSQLRAAAPAQHVA